MNIKDLYKTEQCPICNDKLEIRESFGPFVCVNSDYTIATIDSRFIRIKLSESLICGIMFSDPLTYCLICQSNDIRNANGSTTKRFADSVTLGTISNSKDIEDLKSRFIKLYTSAFL